MPCGATFSFVFTFELGLCITKMWCVSYKQSLLVGLGCVQPCHAPLVCLPLWHVSGHSVLLCLREKISVGRCFLPFFSASRHAHNFTCLMVCIWVLCTWIFVRSCVHLCICVRAPNDTFLPDSIGLSARCRWLSHTAGPSSPPNLAEMGHFSVSGQTIHIGTR